MSPDRVKTVPVHLSPRRQSVPSCYVVAAVATPSHKKQSHFENVATSGRARSLTLTLSFDGGGWARVRLWQTYYANNVDGAWQRVQGTCQACASDETEDTYIPGVLEGCQVNCFLKHQQQNTSGRFGASNACDRGFPTPTNQINCFVFISSGRHMS